MKSGNITAGSRHYIFSWNHPTNHALPHSSIKKWNKHRLHLVREDSTMPLWRLKALKKCDFVKYYREMKGKGEPFFWNARTLKKRTLEERNLSLRYHLFTQKLWKIPQYWGFQARTIIWAIFQASTVWVYVFLLERAKPKSLVVYWAQSWTKWWKKLHHFAPLSRKSRLDLKLYQVKKGKQNEHNIDQEIEEGLT